MYNDLSLLFLTYSDSYINYIKTMNKGPRSNVKSLTGEIVPITFKEM